MKAIFVLIFLFFFQTFSYANVELSSRIDSVIVYPDSSLVNRVATVSIKRGENIFRLTGLPSAIIDNSIQVGIKDNIAKILDVKVEKTFLTKETQEKARSLKEKIEALEGEIRMLNAELSAINNYIEFLRKLSPFATGVKLLQNEFEGYALFIENGIKKGYKNIAEIETKLSKMKEEKTNLEKELSIISKQKEETKNIILTIKGVKEGETMLELTYLVENSRWNPQYDIYVDTVKGTINLDLYASIIQHTGEDWKDVKLEVSTSKPVSGNLGELKPWYVDIYKPREPVIYKSMAIQGELTMGKVKKDSLEDKEEESLPEIKEEQTSFSFLLKDRASIPSDNQPHRVFLATKTVDKGNKEGGIISYNSIPKVSPHVYLTGNFKNPFDFPILSGRMNIYLDGRYVSSENLPGSFSPGQDMQISLGIDESIKIERKRLKKFTEYSGIISKTEKMIFEYEISVNNGKSRNVFLTIRDNYPVSLNEQIKVQLEAPKEKEAEITKDGMITWRLNLEPKTTKKLEMRFTVEYPKDIKITGIE